MELRRKSLKWGLDKISPRIESLKFLATENINRAVVGQCDYNLYE